MNNTTKSKSTFSRSAWIDSVAVVIWCFFLFFYIISSFYFNPTDISWNTASVPVQTPTNPAGKIGAWIMGLAIYLFGQITYLFILPMIFFILYHLRAIESKQRLLRLILAWICLCTTLSFVANQYSVLWNINNVYYFRAGGLGYQFSKILIEFLGTVGAWALILLLFILSLILFFKTAVLKFLLTPIIYLGKNLFITPAKSFFLKAQKTIFFPQKKVSSSSPTNPNIIQHEYKSLQKILDTTFDTSSKKISLKNTRQLEEKKMQIISTLRNFKITGTIIDYQEGPVLSVFEFQMQEGLKQAKLLGLQDDLALALQVPSIFIMPNYEKKSLAIQVPKKNRTRVLFGDLINSAAFQNNKAQLPLSLGVKEDGTPIYEDLAQMPHLLIAGSTGTGKSVCLNSIICSLLLKLSPQEVRFILVDPKILEFTPYEKIPHLLIPVVTESKAATAALNWSVCEMERRYKTMQEANVKNLPSYNSWCRQKISSTNHKPLPYLVIIIDELADLMLSSAKETEQLIQKLSQKARAAGIHLILATQRPSVDVITGTIKTNLPYRISFRVTSRHDSRTILDQAKAEKLLGSGDFLFLKPGFQKLQRVQGAYISEQEIHSLVSQLKKRPSQYDSEALAWMNEKHTHTESLDLNQEVFDPKLQDAINFARSKGEISTSLIQRHFRIGYNRAARIVDIMEEKNLVGPSDGVKPRKWKKQKNNF